MVNLLTAPRLVPSESASPRQLASSQPVYCHAAEILVAGNQTELQRVLRASHYNVTVARTGRDALALAAGRLPDACILDLALPDTGGIAVIAELRRWYKRPIIALSGPASADKIGALDAGADQYVTKPFAMDEFLARLRAVLRRDSGNVIHGPRRPVIGHWQLDLDTRQVTRAAAAPGTAASVGIPRLTPTEWALLEELLRHPGQLVDPAQVMASIWGPGFERRTNYLRFHLAQLRRKLESDPGRPRHLLTEHGMGYRYQP